MGALGFGGVQLKPGLEPKRPYSGSYKSVDLPLFAGISEDAPQPTLQDMGERGYLEGEYGDCWDLVKE